MHIGRIDVVCLPFDGSRYTYFVFRLIGSIKLISAHKILFAFSPVEGTSEQCHLCRIDKADQNSAACINEHWWIIIYYLSICLSWWQVVTDEDWTEASNRWLVVKVSHDAQVHRMSQMQNTEKLLQYWCNTNAFSIIYTMWNFLRDYSLHALWSI